MPDRELAGAHYREDGHRFRGTVHTGSPALAEQQQDRGDQGTGVTDTHPPYEVGDIPTPADGLIQVPLADTVGNHGTHCTPRTITVTLTVETNIPEAAWFHFDRLDDVFRYLVVIFGTIYQRLP